MAFVVTLWIGNGALLKSFSQWQLTLSQTKHFTLFQTGAFANDNFKFDEYGRKCSKRIKNTVGKGEIALYEHFLLFPQCFQKTCTTDT